VIVSDRRESGASGDLKPSDGQNFWRRTASALVLAPLAILVAYIGGWIFAVACAVTGMLVLWEWSGLVTRVADWRILGPGLPALAGAAILTQAGAPGIALAIIVVGTGLAAFATMARGRAERAAQGALWGAAGILYAAVLVISLLLLRHDALAGFAALLFLFATVWSTDIFAYLTGRRLGGPLLWPRLSPKKTWAGVIGGLVGGVVVGSLVAYAGAGTHPVVGGVLALILSVATQTGDVAESAVKRRFGAKDTSGLIPGHGGVMDRVDGLLVAALVAVLIGVLRFDTAAPAGGLLLW
jgi:phosphatidate cytidylyltransferase